MLRSADFRNSVRAKGHSATNVVVLLPEDPVSYLCERLKAVGGQAAVVVGEDKGPYVMLAEAGSRSRPGDDEPVSLAPEASAAMLAEYVRMQRGRAVHFTIQKSDAVLFELIDDDPLMEPVTP